MDDGRYAYFPDDVAQESGFFTTAFDQMDATSGNIRLRARERIGLPPRLSWLPGPGGKLRCDS